MKEKTYRRLMIALLVILCTMSSLAAFSFFQLKQGMSALSSEILNAVPRLEGSAEMSDEESLLAFYGYLYEQMSAYGNLEEYGEQSAQLITTVFEKTLKDCTVSDVTYEDGRILIGIEGTAVNADQINDALIARAAAIAAARYITSDFLGAVSNLFKGEDGIKTILYGNYGQQLLSTITEEINKLEAEPLHYTVQVTLEDGNWKIESLQSNPNAKG